MKAIKITEKNKFAIEQILSSINCKAFAHAYTSFDEVNAVAKTAEKKLSELFGDKKLYSGAVFDSTSGESVPKAYKYSRQSTTIKIARRSTAWYLVDVKPSTIYVTGGKQNLYLTKEQDQTAVNLFKKQYLLSN